MSPWCVSSVSGYITPRLHQSRQPHDAGASFNDGDGLRGAARRAWERHGQSPDGAGTCSPSGPFVVSRRWPRLPARVHPRGFGSRMHAPRGAGRYCRQQDPAASAAASAPFSRRTCDLASDEAPPTRRKNVAVQRQRQPNRHVCRRFGVGRPRRGLRSRSYVGRHAAPGAPSHSRACPESRRCRLISTHSPTSR